MKSHSISTKTKEFSKKLHNVYDYKARKYTKKLLRKIYGFECVDNQDEFGPDLLAYDGDKFIGYVECEVKEVWTSEKFPYKTIQIPFRKKKFVDAEAPILFVMFNYNFSQCLTVDGLDLALAKVSEVPNKYVDEGEYFYQVSRFHAKYYDITGM